MISTFLLSLQRIGHRTVLKVLYRVKDTMPRHNIKSLCLFLLRFFSMISFEKPTNKTIEIKHNICTTLPNNYNEEKFFLWQLTYTCSIEESRAASKSPHWKLGYFLSLSQQGVSADIIQNSAVIIPSPPHTLTLSNHWAWSGKERIVINIFKKLAV